MRKIPYILEMYLERTGQYPAKMTNEQLLGEAEWELWNCNNEDGYMKGYDYTPQQVGALKRYINVLKTEAQYD